MNLVEARYDAIADFYAEGWPDGGDDPVARMGARPDRRRSRDVGDEPDEVFR
jgi:hypothetical protein